MQALAEDAAELLPQEQEQKKRGRGRAKKDLRLVDALHQCWQGKVGDLLKLGFGHGVRSCSVEAAADV
jgi:hypothetical protein